MQHEPSCILIIDCDSISNKITEKCLYPAIEK